MSKDMIIHDISLTLATGVVVWPKDVPYQRRLRGSIEHGDHSNLSQVDMSAHTGTHVDAPLHFVPDGYGVDEIPLDHLYGRAYVADCRAMPIITGDVLKKRVPQDTKRLLLKTDNSQLLGDGQVSFDPDFVYIDQTAAQFIVDQGILLLGMDYLSIGKPGEINKTVHQLLLGNNVTILETITLEEIEPGEYFLACGPLKLAGSDGAPCRVALIENLI